MKKMLKKLKKSLEGKKKGVPLQSRSGRGALRGPGDDRKRGAGGHPGGGHRKFIEKTGQRQYKRSTEKQRASIRGRDTGIEDGATGHSLRYNKDYTMKSLILAQDER